MIKPVRILILTLCVAPAGVIASDSIDQRVSANEQRGAGLAQRVASTESRLDELETWRVSLRDTLIQAFADTEAAIVAAFGQISGLNARVTALESGGASGGSDPATRQSAVDETFVAEYLNDQVGVLRLDTHFTGPEDRGAFFGYVIFNHDFIDPGTNPLGKNITGRIYVDDCSSPSLASPTLPADKGGLYEGMTQGALGPDGQVWFWDISYPPQNGITLAYVAQAGGCALANEPLAGPDVRPILQLPGPPRDTGAPDPEYPVRVGFEVRG